MHDAEIMRGWGTVRLLAAMRPQTWKRIALIMLGLTMIAIPVLVVVFLEGEKPTTGTVVFALGLDAMIAFWPGYPLLWNVHGEEMVDVSATSLRWRYNYGIFQSGETIVGHRELSCTTSILRSYRGVDYGSISFWGIDPNGFDRLLYETVIPIPMSSIDTFLEYLDGILPQKELPGEEFPVMLPN